MEEKIIIIYITTDPNVNKYNYFTICNSFSINEKLLQYCIYCNHFRCPYKHTHTKCETVKHSKAAWSAIFWEHVF